ncbi:Unknown protein sequence [Pseudomonas coronafaciens pv. oryzae]|nr:Unknown protein sequence [Pseudomonas coronafaciens pv. oryzae]
MLFSEYASSVLKKIEHGAFSLFRERQALCGRLFRGGPAV